MTVATSPPIDIPLERMTEKQKWELIQALLDDLEAAPATADDPEVPAWHMEVLAERGKALAAGETELIGVEQLMGEVRMETK